MSDWDEFFQNQFNHNRYHLENPYLSYTTIYNRYLTFLVPFVFLINIPTSTLGLIFVPGFRLYTQ